MSGATTTQFRKCGHSKDRRPEQPRVIMCASVGQHRWSMTWDILVSHHRFLRLEEKGYSHRAVRADERLNGKFVLQTSCDLQAAELLAEAYRILRRMERKIREAK